MMGHELRCRRLALGLDQRDLADVLKTKQFKVSRWETGAAGVPEWVAPEITVVEQQQDQLVASYVAAGTARAYVDEETWWAAAPKFEGVPLAVQLVAAARARRQLGGSIERA